MRLLSLEQVKERTSKERDEKVIFGAKLASEVDRLRITVNNLKDEKEKIVKETIGIQEKTLLEQQEKIKEMEQKTKELEQRKKEALKPVEDLLKETERLKKEQEEREKELKKEQIAIDGIKTKITEQLESLGDLQDSLKAQAHDLQKRAEAVQMQEQWSKVSVEKLTEEWQNFNSTARETQHFIQEKSSELQSKEKSLSVREKELEMERKKLAEEKEHFFLQQRAFKLALQEHNVVNPTTIWQMK